MGKRTEQTFFQRRHTDGQQAHEKILNIVNQRNKNENYSEIPPYACQNGYHQKSLQMMNVDEDVEKREPSYTVRGNVNWGSYYGRHYGGFQNYRMTQQFHSGISPRETKIPVQKDTCTPMFMAILFIIFKTQKQHNGPTDK